MVYGAPDILHSLSLFLEFVDMAGSAFGVCIVTVSCSDTFALTCELSLSIFNTSLVSILCFIDNRCGQYRKVSRHSCDRED